MLISRRPRQLADFEPVVRTLAGRLRRSRELLTIIVVVVGVRRLRPCLRAQAVEGERVEPAGLVLEK